MKTVYLVSVDGCGFSACGSFKKAEARVREWLDNAQPDEAVTGPNVWRFSSDHGTAWVERLPLE
jgi:hypothetical protein